MDKNNIRMTAGGAGVITAMGLLALSFSVQASAIDLQLRHQVQDSR